MFLFFIFLQFIYLFIHERHIQRERQRYRQKEKQAPCGEHDVGLDPGSSGSCPGVKGDAKPSHPGVPINKILKTQTWLFEEKCKMGVVR